jgi:hypothetical protein
MPIMVCCNILRVTTTATMYVIDKPQFGQELMHELMGVVLLIPALLLLMGLGKFLSSLYVDVEDDEPGAPANGPAPLATPAPPGPSAGPAAKEDRP